MYSHPPFWAAIWAIMPDDHQNNANSLRYIEIYYAVCHILYSISICLSVSAFVASYP